MKRAGLFVILAAGLYAQQPEIENAQVSQHVFSGTLGGQLASLGAGPLWAGYSVPTITPRRGDGCWTNGDGSGGHSANAPVRLEGQTSLVILVRMEAGKVDRLQTTSADCRLDGGNLPFHWFTGVPVTASVEWLKTQITAEKSDRAIYPLAMHPGPEAARAMEELTAATQPEKVRERAAFWLGNTRGAQGVEVLKRMLATDPDRRVKEQVVFAFKSLPAEQGIPMLIDIAKNNPDLAVRKKAMFWLGQSKDTRALDFFAQVLKP